MLLGGQRADRSPRGTAAGRSRAVRPLASAAPRASFPGPPSPAPARRAASTARPHATGLPAPSLRPSWGGGRGRGRGAAPWGGVPHEDVGDLAADQVDQQQVAQRLLGRAELGVGRDLDDERLRVIAPRRQAKSSPSGSLVGRTSSAGAARQRTRSVTPPRRRMASPWCSMSHLALLSLSLAGSGMVHRALESRTVRPTRWRRLRHRAGHAPHHTPCRFGPERKIVAGPAR